jgi:L,D-transpeptidase ErfK/SrfK
MPNLFLILDILIRYRVRSPLGVFFILFGVAATCPAFGATYQPSWPIFSVVLGGEALFGLKKNDSLYSISGRGGSTWQYLAQKNNLIAPFKLSIGQRLMINNRHIIPQTQITDGLLLNIPGHMLYLFELGILTQRLPVGVGRPDWPTPVGFFKIMGKHKNPTWTVPKSIQEELIREGKIVREKVPPGPDNPLGKYWLPLSIAGYGIHATIWPESIGHSTTHGCIRMTTEDIGNLFKRIKPGIPITIVYEPLKMAITSDNKIFLEAHSNTYQKPFSYWDHVKKLSDEKGLSGQIDWDKAAQVLNERNGIAEDITLK